MEIYWAVRTNGNPIGAVQEIVLNFWEQLNLEAMIVPIESAINKIPKATVVLNTDFIKNLNPFKPVMADNSAKLVPEFINKFQDKKLGVILRPCEMNTLIASSDIGGFSLHNVFTISFDCLGTLPVADYLWKIEHKPANSYCYQKFLQFSRTGGNTNLPQPASLPDMQQARCKPRRPEHQYFRSACTQSLINQE